MKNFSRFLVLIAFLLSVINVKADFVDVNLAEEVALNYLVITSKTTSDVTLTLAHTEYVNNTPVHYVFNIDNSGHIIIAADDRVSPIRAYVPNGTYIINSDNPGVAWFIDKQKGFFVDSVINGLTTRKLNGWDFYSDRNNQNLSISLAVVGPLLSSGWGQGGNHNDVVESNTGSNVLVGCVAVAMGQIMNYYQHPYQGEGNTTVTSSCTAGSITCDCSCSVPAYYPLTNDHSSTQHDWSNIGTGTCNSSNPTASVSQAASGDGTAQLLYELGVSVYMNYSTTFSGACTPDAEDALENHWGFDNDLDEDNRSTWVGNWESAIISDLDNSNPVYLDGSSAALGGHAWVCDGYDDGPSTTLFHMNWGWNCSTQDGWYSISGNNPSTQFPTSEGRIKEIFPGTDLIAMSGYTSTFSGGIFTHRVENDFGNGAFESSDSRCNPYKAKYYASTNTNLDVNNDYYLGSKTDYNGLPGNGNYEEFNKTIDLSSVPAGNYHILYWIDADQEVWERDNNNVYIYGSQVAFTGVEGCTDPAASNYNSSATIDDGSCLYADLAIINEGHLITWCQFPPCESPPVTVNGPVIEYNVSIANYGSGSAPISELGYYLSANTNIMPNGGADYLLGTDIVSSLSAGATQAWNETATFDLSDPLFSNISDGTYYIGAFIDHDYNISESDESNNDAAFYSFFMGMPNNYYQVVIQRGCTDPYASNYDPNATIDDGSCICNLNEVTVSINTYLYGSEVSWDLTNSAGVIVASGSGYLSQSSYSYLVCLPDDCYSMNMYDSYGDGWNGGSYNIDVSGFTVASGGLSSGSSGSDPVQIGAIPCCNDNIVTLDMYDSYGDGWNGNTYILLLMMQVLL